jgi:CarboxypepD_reg-like domain
MKLSWKAQAATNNYCMKSILLSVTFFLCGAQMFAQGKGIPILERKIDLTSINEKLPSALSRIARQAGFSFSYNTALIASDQSVNVTVRGKTIREVLDLLFKGSLKYKEKDTYLILTKAPPAKINSTAVYIISGYVEDEQTGEKIPEASVYDKSTLTSAVTNEYGYYKIKLDPTKKHEPVSLSVSKSNYRDTLVVVTAATDQAITIVIKPIGKDSVKITASIPSDTARQIQEEIKLPPDAEANIRNILDTLYRNFQVSVVPFVGSNGRLSGNVINDYSFNMFGGYSLGTRKIELGLWVNADRGDVSYLQIAGIGNAVGGNVSGFQIGGIFNVDGGKVNAVQASGLANVNFKEMHGVQATGLTNINLRSADGVSVAGLGNYSNGRSEGMQIAGLGNVHLKDFEGLQVAGLGNISTDKLWGSQIAGLFNYGGKVHGTQVALFNFADSLGGVPIGLFSFVKRGYHKVEISADEIFYTNLAFRTGVHRFYNILAAGMKPDKAFGTNDNVWTFGYGVGTAPKITRWLYFNLDVTTNQVNKGSFTESLSLLNKVYLGFDVQFSKKMSLTFGATLNGYLSNPNYSDNPILFTDNSPKIISDHNFSNTVNMKMWWGLKAGLRFF